MKRNVTCSDQMKKANILGTANTELEPSHLMIVKSIGLKTRKRNLLDMVFFIRVGLFVILLYSLFCDTFTQSRKK